MKFRLELSEQPQSLPLDFEALSREIEPALALLLGGADASAVVTFVPDENMRELNSRYRGIDEATDVLSFPLWEEEGRFVPPSGWAKLPLGDVVVSPDFVKANAVRENIGYNNEMVRMIVHGVLHLVGYDHDTEERRSSMWELQERIVAGYGQNADASGGGLMAE